MFKKFLDKKLVLVFLFVIASFMSGSVFAMQVKYSNGAKFPIEYENNGTYGKVVENLLRSGYVENIGEFEFASDCYNSFKKNLKNMAFIWRYWSKPKESDLIQIKIETSVDENNELVSVFFVKGADIINVASYDSSRGCINSPGQIIYWWYGESVRCCELFGWNFDKYCEYLNSSLYSSDHCHNHSIKSEDVEASSFKCKDLSIIAKRKVF